jgi:hypothetical protein
MKDYSKAIEYCYTRLYNNSEPKAKWKELLANAETNKQGQKIIPYNNYRIEESKMDKIIEQTIEKFKIKGYNKEAFKNTIYLGCSPVLKINYKIKWQS